jgi:hypothetical protein
VNPDDIVDVGHCTADALRALAPVGRLRMSVTTPQVQFSCCLGFGHRVLDDAGGIIVAEPRRQFTVNETLRLEGCVFPAAGPVAGCLRGVTERNTLAWSAHLPRAAREALSAYLAAPRFVSESRPPARHQPPTDLPLDLIDIGALRATWDALAERGADDPLGEVVRAHHLPAAQVLALLGPTRVERLPGDGLATFLVHAARQGHPLEVTVFGEGCTLRGAIEADRVQVDGTMLAARAPCALLQLLLDDDVRVYIVDIPDHSTAVPHFELVTGRGERCAVIRPPVSLSTNEFLS